MLFFSILGEWGGWVLESMENSILFLKASLREGLKKKIWGAIFVPQSKLCEISGYGTGLMLHIHGVDLFLRPPFWKMIFILLFLSLPF